MGAVRLRAVPFDGRRSPLSWRTSVAGRSSAASRRVAPIRAGATRRSHDRTVSRIAPMPLIDVSMRSPGRIGPTPGGAPVKMRSPGTSVMTREA
jgi:hypothetical protein